MLPHFLPAVERVVDVLDDELRDGNVGLLRLPILHDLKQGEADVD